MDDIKKLALLAVAGVVAFWLVANLVGLDLLDLIGDNVRGDL